MSDHDPHVHITIEPSPSVESLRHDLRDVVRLIARLTDRVEYLATLLVDVVAGLNTIETNQENTMTDLSAIQAAVQRDTDVTNSAVTLLGSLAQQIRDLSTDPAALAALADSIDQNTNALAAAVADTSGGSTEPAPPDEPPVEEPPVDTTPPDELPTDTGPVPDDGTFPSDGG